MQNQQRVIDAANSHGNENVVVILGSSDAEGAGIYAETVTNGDPTFAGPLAGVQLGLAVYHVFEKTVKDEIDPAPWEEQIGMMEMVLDTEGLSASVAEMREQFSKYTLL